MCQIHISRHNDRIALFQGIVGHTIAFRILQTGLHIVPLRLSVFQGKHHLLARTQHHGTLRDYKLSAQSGDKVIVTPYSDAGSRQEGRITQINPLVDDKGMVKVKATVNGKGRLFSGSEH